jgi:hypothetical protein
MGYSYAYIFTIDKEVVKATQIKAWAKMWYDKQPDDLKPHITIWSSRLGSNDTPKVHQPDWLLNKN